MFTDVVGFTALTQSDEQTALRLLRELRDFVRPILRNHRGRQIKAIGDGLLIEFANALAAVECAVDLQRRLHDRFGRGEAPTLRLRVGVHLGDVQEEGADIIGDAVNLASRIEPLAEPGGICLSAQVYDQIRNKVPYRLESIGLRTLKGIQQPTEVYKVGLPWTAEGSKAEAAPTRRLAVLPLANLSPEPKDEFFADGLTEEMISELSRLAELRVIARTSVMKFRTSNLSVSEIGRELRAGTILEGSVRKSGNRLRITVQLVDAASEEHMWSETYDRELTDIFAIQTEVAKSVAGALHLQFSPSTETARPATRDLDAYSWYHQGRSLWNKRSPEAVHAALGLFEKARSADPKYARAYSGIADCYSLLVDRVVVPWRDTRAKMAAAAREAVLLDDLSADAHASLGLTLYWEYDWAQTEREFRRAIELNPNYASAQQWLYQVLDAQGRTEEALQALAQAEEADPLSPVILRYVGYAAWVAGRDAEALQKWDRVLELEGEPEWIVADRACFCIKRSMRAEALEWLRRYERMLATKPARAVLLGFLYASLDLRSDAERHLRSLLAEREHAYVPSTSIAWTYAGLNDVDGFYTWMRRAADEHSIDPHLLASFPLIQHLRSDSRFADLLARCKILGRPPAA